MAYLESFGATHQIRNRTLKHLCTLFLTQLRIPADVSWGPLTTLTSFLSYPAGVNLWVRNRAMST